MTRYPSGTPLLARATVHILWAVAMLLIAATSLTCALSVYQSLSYLISRDWSASGGLAGLSFAMAVASVSLCRYRGDLVGEL